MGVDPITIGIALSVLSSVGAVVGGIQQSKEASKQAKLAQREAELQARAEARENIFLEKRQKLAFLKSGVSLEGSPLLLLAETRRMGGENIQAIITSGSTRASSIRASGRQALIGGLTKGIGTAASGFSSFGGK